MPPAKNKTLSTTGEDVFNLPSISVPSTIEMQPMGWFNLKELPCNHFWRPILHLFTLLSSHQTATHGPFSDPFPPVTLSFHSLSHRDHRFARDLPPYSAAFSTLGVKPHWRVNNKGHIPKVGRHAREPSEKIGLFNVFFFLVLYAFAIKSFTDSSMILD